MKRHENYVAQVCFIELSCILKENEGIYNREIANYIGVESSLFCRWLHNHICLPECYNEKLRDYFSHENFAKYRAIMVERILSALEVPEQSILAFLFKNMQYGVLLNYLFCELKLTNLDLYRENHMGDMLSEIVMSALERKHIKNICKMKLSRPKKVDYSDVDGEYEEMREMDEKYNKNAFVIETEYLHKKGKCIVIYLIPEEKAKKKEECMAISNHILKSRAFGPVSIIAFLRMPELFSANEVYKEIERYGDYSARKIIKIIKKIEING